ncbi:MAG: phosphate acyltransferase PlsX [Gemmatimonadota bacterium]|nr:MAG: phosphate acyltransferase PlsX [Gemmatimonadota bacterium]
MRIALDAMGGDNSPAVPVRGGVEALQHLESDFELLLVGDPGAIEEELEGQGIPGDRLRIIPASGVIGMGDAPVESVRRKPDSSIVRGVQLQESGEADAFVSAGSTGAIVAASTLILGSMPGMDRPAIGALLPTTAARPTLMVDAGANVDCKPEQLEEFAHLGHVYMQDVEGRQGPKVGLLNICAEPDKGNELTLEAYRLLERSGLNFIGNVEGRYFVTGVCDVLVCDGFVGNVVLKSYESVAEQVAHLVSRTAAGTEDYVDLLAVCRVLDYAEHGGAPLLGANGVTIICHGDSPARAIRNAVRVAARSVESGMVEHLRRELSSLASARA